MHKTELKYRRDIDGLRAIAVLLVIFFHLGVPGVSGGFIGVDVFFVISGYLITGIISKEIAASRFSILGFYERRARRILPALMGVLVVSTLLSLHHLLPGELIAYAKSLLGAALSYSNFYFWSTADYFDAPAQSKPLLHTWSLAVEEQFYVVLPMLLVFLSRKWPRLRNGVLVLLAAASFLCSVWMSIKQPDSAFYLPVSRAWELLAGSLIVLDIVPAIHSKWMRELSAIAGLGMVLYAAHRLTSNTAFPGFPALLPAGGTSLLVAAGRYGETTVGKLLSLKPVTFVGLISYSVYLWHWPLIVYTKMGFLPLLPRSHRPYVLEILCLSLLLGAISWQFIEKPFRTGVFRGLGRANIFRLAGVSLGACVFVALIFIGKHGFESRFPAKAVQVAELVNIPQQNRLGSCFITTKYRFSDYKKSTCLQIEPGKKNYLLLGDSHSAALWYGLDKVLPADNIMQASVSGCKISIVPSGSDNCREMIRYIFGDFLVSHHVDAVFLTARWSSFNEFAKLKDTVAWCESHQLPVIIFGPVMEFDTPLPKLLAYSIAFNEPQLVQRHELYEFFNLDAAMRQRAEDTWHADYVSVLDVQCPNRACIPYADPAQTVAMLDDDNHLSNLGSQFVIARLLALRELPSQ